MSAVTITTRFERKISVESPGTRGAILAATDTESCNSVSTYLTKEEIRLLVDALEPYAAKPKTSLELFDEMPLGAKFRLEGETTERVKITEDEYVILGKSFFFSKESVNGVTIVEGN